MDIPKISQEEKPMVYIKSASLIRKQFTSYKKHVKHNKNYTEMNSNPFITRRIRMTKESLTTELRRESLTKNMQRFLLSQLSEINESR